MEDGGDELNFGTKKKKKKSKKEGAADAALEELAGEVRVGWSGGMGEQRLGARAGSMRRASSSARAGVHRSSALHLLHLASAGVAL